MSKIHRGCNILATRYASPDTKKVILRTVIFSQAMYAAKFCDWNLVQCCDLNNPIEAVYRNITKNMASFPTLLLYLATQIGGLDLPRLSDNLQIKKWQMIHRLLQSDPGSTSNPYPNVLRSVIE